MKIFTILFIIIGLFQYIQTFPTGSDKCYSQMPKDMATTDPTVNLTITTNFGLNNYESCGRIPFTLEFDGSIKGILISVRSNSTNSVVGSFEENNSYHTILDDNKTGRCITHTTNFAKQGPLTFYWIAPDTDDNLIISVFAVRTRAGEPEYTTWGETYLDITFSKSNCSIVDTNITFEGPTDNTEIVSTTEILNTEVEITTEVESTTDIENATAEVDSTIDIASTTTDILETENNTEVIVDITETSGNENTEVYSEAGEIDTSTQDTRLSTSQLSSTSTNKPSSSGSTSNTRATAAPSPYQESNSNTEQIVFGFGLLLFSIIF